MTNLAAAHQRHLFDPRFHWKSDDAPKLARLCDMTETAVMQALAMRSLYRAALPATVAAPLKKSGAARYTFTISSAMPDRMNDIVRQEGIVTTDYRKNPVVLWAHDATAVIGKAVSLSIVNGRLQSTMQFNPQSGLARSIESAVRGGYIRASSIGFRPLDWTPRGDGSILFNQVELLEYSIVGIPAQQEALLVGMTDASGKAFGPKVKAKREREIELIKLRSVPLTEKQKREVDLARIKRCQ